MSNYTPCIYVGEWSYQNGLPCLPAPPPPPPPVLSNPSGNGNGPSISPITSPTVIALVLIIASVALCLFCGIARLINQNAEEAEPIVSSGLEDSVIKMIPVRRYSKRDTQVESSECAVCLSSFEEDESVRMLPQCNHAFHLPCIDKWFESHLDCPLCRATITLDTMKAPILSQQPTAKAAALPITEAFEERDRLSDLNRQPQVVESSHSNTRTTMDSAGLHDKQELELLRRDLHVVCTRDSARLGATEGELVAARENSYAGRTLGDGLQGVYVVGRQLPEECNRASCLPRSLSTGSLKTDVVVEIHGDGESEEGLPNVSKCLPSVEPARK